MSTVAYKKTGYQFKPDEEELPEVLDLLEKGAVEISQINEERQFLLNGTIYYKNGSSHYSYIALIEALQKNNSFNGGEILDVNNNFQTGINGSSYYTKLPSKLKPKSLLKIKQFKVKVDLETEEILEGKEELIKFNILGLRKLNRKEEDVINVRELADFLASEDAKRLCIDFDIEKDKGKYEELYKKNFKNIIRFRSEN